MMLHSLVKVSASWDTQQRPSYNPNAPRKSPPQNPKSDTFFPTSTTTTTTVTVNGTSKTLTLTPQSVSELLKRNSTAQDFEESYLGYKGWLPSPPKVEKPRSVYNAATLAYIGDSIYELYARKHFLFPPLNIDEYNDHVTAVVRCEAQDALLQKLLNENYLSAEEKDVLRWGRNIGSAKTRTKKRAGVAVYNRASSLETLVGYLYLTNVSRLEEVMLKLGFLTGPSTQTILEEVNGEEAG